MELNMKTRHELAVIANKSKDNMKSVVKHALALAKARGEARGQKGYKWACFARDIQTPTGLAMWLVDAKGKKGMRAPFRAKLIAERQEAKPKAKAKAAPSVQPAATGEPAFDKAAFEAALKAVPMAARAATAASPAFLAAFIR